MTEGDVFWLGPERGGELAFAYGSPPFLYDVKGRRIERADEYILLTTSGRPERGRLERGVNRALKQPQQELRDLLARNVAASCSKWSHKAMVSYTARYNLK